VALEVNIESKILDLSRANLQVDEEAQQFQRESWPVRRDQFKKKGTDTQFNKLPTLKWLDSIKVNDDGNEDESPPFPLMVLIDGTFAHSAAVHFAGKYIDYRRLQLALLPKAEKIHYFSASSESDSILRFLNHIRSIPGCEVVVKELPKTIDQKDKRLAHPAYKSVAVDMSVIALREVYENPNVTHMLILSRDPEIIPLIRELKDLDIKVTLAVSEDIPTSRALKLECDSILDIYEMFASLNAYSDAHVRHKPRVEHTETEVVEDQNDE